MHRRCVGGAIKTFTRDRTSRTPVDESSCSQNSERDIFFAAAHPSKSLLFFSICKQKSEKYDFCAFFLAYVKFFLLILPPNLMCTHVLSGPDKVIEARRVTDIHDNAFFMNPADLPHPTRNLYLFDIYFREWSAVGYLVCYHRHRRLRILSLERRNSGSSAR